MQGRSGSRGRLLRGERVHRAGDPARRGRRLPGRQDGAQTSAAARPEHREYSFKLEGRAQS